MTATITRNQTSRNKTSNAPLEGVPLLNHLAESFKLKPIELGEKLDISPRTIQRRLNEHKLSDSERMKLQMTAHILERANRVLGGPDHARTWMNSPLIALENHSPLELLRDIHGYERVRTVLGRIASGTF